MSADLLELARTPGLLVCSGPKSIIDPAATAEKLEELGVALVGYGVDRLPFFLAREAPVELEHRVDTPVRRRRWSRAAARSGRARRTVLLCNPVPGPHAMDADEVADGGRPRRRLEPSERACTARRARRSCLPRSPRSPAAQPRANLALLEDNARVAGLVAASLAAG